ncbi:matrixin family metalloprotease [Robertmurraya beringensis]|uniref:Matrixin family metalloprotease n=1 Tax=Robertmurraya beringensis TaxID=641660 RepID=A0ABV6KRA1_9BACI
MLKKITLVSILVLFSSLIIYKVNTPKNTDAAVIVVKVLTWDLVDSGKHLDWGGSSKYSTNLSSGATVWNNYKSGVIRPDTASTLQDVTISDYYEVSSTAGVTSSGGTLKFNDYKMSGYDSTKKKNVAMHELGHALGLAHNLSGDVMYAYVSTVVTLSFNDKASYDEAYRKY